MPGRAKQPIYQEALSSATPKPFSQFSAPSGEKYAGSASSKPKKLRKIIGVVLAILLVIGIGIGIYALWHGDGKSIEVPAAVKTNDEDKLNQAIENHLRTDKVRQVFNQTVTAADTSTFTIDATSNFSDPLAPKSRLTYTLKSGGKADAVEGGGELIIQDENEYYAKLTKPALFYAGNENGKPKENQWYIVPVTDTAGDALMDPLAARMSINASLGEFPVGNFNEAMRKELLQFVKDKKVYKITSSDKVVVNEAKMTHYILAIDATQLNELNRKVFVATGGKVEDSPIDFTKNGTKKVEVWIGDDSTKIAKIKIDRESKGDDRNGAFKESTIIDVTYPADVPVIQKPESAVPLNK
jgi:hypothetical protein